MLLIICAVAVAGIAVEISVPGSCDGDECAAALGWTCNGRPRPARRAARHGRAPSGPRLG